VRRRVRSRGGSTRHQPQINYHFESKAALWTAAVDYLFGLLGEALEGVIPTKLTGVDCVGRSLQRLRMGYVGSWDSQPSTLSSIRSWCMRVRRPATGWCG